ncbi:MAG: TIGR03086 family metal-binding protein [Egibacteraceae bacterium]
MDIIKLLDVGFDWTGRRVAAVRPEHWPLDTPCDEWTVRQLLNHMLGAMDVITSTVAGQAWPEGVNAQTLAETDRIGRDPAAAFAEIAQRALAVWHTPGVLERTCGLRGVPTPAITAAQLSLTDAVVHGWDIAQATGENADIPDELAEPLLDIDRTLIHEGLRGTVFADEVHIEVGSASDRLVAFLGRTP